MLFVKLFLIFLRSVRYRWYEATLS